MKTSYLEIEASGLRYILNLGEHVNCIYNKGIIKLKRKLRRMIVLSII